MTTLHFSHGTHGSSASLPSYTAEKNQPSAPAPLTGDLDSLAQHMRHCAAAQGKRSRFQLALEDAHVLAPPRIVTLVAVVTLLAVAAASVVVSVLSIA